MKCLEKPLFLMTTLVFTNFSTTALTATLDPCGDIITDFTIAAGFSDDFSSPIKTINSPIIPGLKSGTFTSQTTFTGPDTSGTSKIVSDCVSLMKDLMTVEGSISSGGSGSGVDNGTGLVESFFANALINLEVIIKSALQNSTTLTQNDRNLLDQIMKALPQELRAKPLIVFNQGGSAFIIDGLPRIAFTKNTVGEKIHINQKELYRSSGNAKIPAISYPLAIQIIVHELGHHQGETDHDYLNELGAQVAKHYSLPSSNNLVNGSFEKTTPGGIPSNWYVGYQNLASLYTDSLYSAKGSISLALISYSPFGTSNIYQCFEVDQNEKFVAMRVSALLLPWLGYNSFGSLLVQVFNESGLLESYSNGIEWFSLGNYNILNYVVFGQSDWQFKHLEFGLSLQAKTVCLGFYIQGMGTMKIDDVNVDFFK